MVYDGQDESTSPCSRLTSNGPYKLVHRIGKLGQLVPALYTSPRIHRYVSSASLVYQFLYHHVSSLYVFWTKRQIRLVRRLCPILDIRTMVPGRTIVEFQRSTSRRSRLQSECHLQQRREWIRTNITEQKKKNSYKVGRVAQMDSTGKMLGSAVRRLVPRIFSAEKTLKNIFRRPTINEISNLNLQRLLRFWVTMEHTHTHIKNQRK